MSIRLLVCCDNPLMSAGFQAFLVRQPDIEVTSVANGSDVLDAAKKETPDVTLVAAPALTMDDRYELAELAALTKVILIALPENVYRSVEAIRAGVRAVLSPDSSVEELVHVLRIVSEGDTIAMPVAARHGLGCAADENSPSELIAQLAERLTPRESEVLLLLAQGKSNAEIAAELSVSTPTVRSHVHHLLRKLNVGTRAQAVAVAYETGLIRRLSRR